MRHLKQTLNVSDFEGFDPVRFPDGREEHGLGDVLEELEELIGNLQRLLTPASCKKWWRAGSI